MNTPPACPRCGNELLAPSLVSSDWRCAAHGPVHPMHVLSGTNLEALEHVRSIAAVPLWLPDPLLPHWTVSGVGYAGDERSGARATALACSGPAPLGGVADMVLVAEEPAVGLGAGYAGLSRTDPGPAVTGGAATKMEVAGHPTAVWPVRGPVDRCVFVGEARAVWLWIILWPAEAGYVLAEHLVLSDLRDRMPPAALPFGAPSPYLNRSAQV